MSYQDGKYQTEAEGLHGPVKVATTITGGKISAVEVLVGAGEYQSKANDVIASEIIAAQSTDVDAVSGATVSSNAIMTAVKKALQEASGESQDKTSEELTTDLAIVAAGPAGLAAAVSAAEQGSPGGPPTWVWGHWGSIARFKRPTSMKSQWLKP